MTHAPNLVASTASNTQVASPVVTIQALRIDGRRLTQAIFKQMPRCDLIDPETMEPAGFVWGWVNCDPEYSVARVYVVQKGDKLYRAEFLPFTARQMRERSTPLSNYPHALSELIQAIRDSPDRHPEFVAGWDGMVGRLLAFDQLYIGA